MKGDVLEGETLRLVHSLCGGAETAEIAPFLSLFRFSRQIVLTVGRPLRMLRFTASFLVSCNLKLLKSSLPVRLEGRFQLRLRNSLEQKLPWLSSLPGSSLCGPPASCLPAPFLQLPRRGPRCGSAQLGAGKKSALPGFCGVGLLSVL